MYILKQIPEDFIVEEIPEIEFKETGKYAIFLLTKKNYTTTKAIKDFARKHNIPENEIKFAGAKDKNAITKQYVSVPKHRIKSQDYSLQDISLKFIDYSDEQLYLGCLKQNKFEIVLRDLEKNCRLKPEKKMINYFDDQRFSNNNVEIGKLILHKDYKSAISLILDSNTEYKNEIEAFLEKNKNNFIGALKCIRKELLKIYIHAYQSWLFNEFCKEWINTNKMQYKEIKINTMTLYFPEDLEMENIKIPLIGFGSEYENKKIEKVYKKILEKEKITQRDFIIGKDKDLSNYGNERDMIADIIDLKISKPEKDELNTERFKIKISFTLDKGCYATIAVKQLSLMMVP